MREKTQDELALQALHRVRPRLVSRRTATINQIRAFLIEQGIAVRTGSRALRNSLRAILENRQDEISLRMRSLIAGLYEDWICLDERIEAIAGEIETIGEKEANCRRLMSIPGIGHRGPHHSITTSQYARLVSEWIGSVGLDPKLFGTHSLRRTKATLIYRRTGNLRAVQLLLEHTKIVSTVRYLCIEVDDALAIAEQVDV